MTIQKHLASADMSITACIRCLRRELPGGEADVVIDKLHKVRLELVKVMEHLKERETGESQ